MYNITVDKKTWFVIYTRSRSEKKVVEELSVKNIECYLPLQKTLRKWKDRKKWIEIPLISGYCFVYITHKQYDKVLQTNNVVSYVTFKGKAAKIPDEQIDYLKRMLNHNDIEVSVSQNEFKSGQRVEIIRGPLIGLRGELVEAHGRQKFILRFQEINSIFTVEIDKNDITHILN